MPRTVALVAENERELPGLRRRAARLYPDAAAEDYAGAPGSPAFVRLVRDVAAGQVGWIVSTYLPEALTGFVRFEGLIRKLLSQGVEVDGFGDPSRLRELAEYRALVQRGGGAPAGNRNRDGKGVSYTPAQAKDVLRRRSKGTPIRTIAREVGLSAGAVDRIIRKAASGD